MYLHVFSNHKHRRLQFYIDFNVLCQIEYNKLDITDKNRPGGHVVQFTTGSQFLNNTTLRKLQHCHQVIYNRLPKCGSRSVLRTFDVLAKINGFNHIDKINWNGWNFLPRDEIKVSI